MKRLNTVLLVVIVVLLAANLYFTLDKNNSATPVQSAVANPQATNPNTPQYAKPSAVNRPLTAVKFEDMSYDFGTIQQDTHNTHDFKFTNNGKQPLVIENARGSCGCTVPEYPKEPIAPGQSGVIKVVYSPGKQKNQQTKTITITANTQPKNTILTIKANVVPANS